MIQHRFEYISSNLLSKFIIKEIKKPDLGYHFLSLNEK